MLPQALEVMKTWGFEYKSHAIWAKDRVGTGYWFRARALVGRNTRAYPSAGAHVSGGFYAALCTNAVYISS
jgi:hypothetical protein